MLNKLLQRQIQKYLSEINDLPVGLKVLFQVISESYDHFEKDRKMLERSIELSSNEMIELNNQLRKEKEELTEAHIELKTLFENIEDVFFSVNMATNQLLQISDACEQVFGYPATAFRDNPSLWYEIIVEEDKKIIHARNPVMRSGRSFSEIYRIKHGRGNIRWVETKISPTLDENKQLIRIDGVTSDITEKIINEQKLAESEIRFRSLIENSTDMLSIVDQTGTVLYESPSIELRLVIFREKI